jgi:carbohydrate-selective porin OprB
LNFRIGAASEKVSLATRFAAIAYERRTSHGLLGAGLAMTAFTDQSRHGELENAADVEIFYRIPIGGDSGHITPSVQYVENPGFDGQGGTAPSAAVVAGVRFHWAF